MCEINRQITVTLTLLLLSVVSIAQKPIDGPFVFYEGGKALVKQVVLEDNRLVVHEVEYQNKNAIPNLICGIDQDQGHSFQFSLMKSIRTPHTTYAQPEKLLAISDIEGNFEILTQTLIGNEVINEQYDWIFGQGHLVLLGDIFDRGINVTACLWLIYKLEQEASRAGGTVHFIIGNHEEMNMRGDLRYLMPKYLKIAEKLNVEYQYLYSKHTELGRWLRSKNVVEKIGNTLFVHGGISPIVAQSNLSLKQINLIARANYGSPLADIAARTPEDVLVMHTNKGPMWYRGYFGRALDASAITMILQKYDINQLVVGHTVMDEVCSYYDNRLIAIDVKHEQCLNKNLSNALYQVNDQFFKTNTKGERSIIEAGNAVFHDNSISDPIRINPIDLQADILAAVREGNVDKLTNYLESGIDVNNLFTTKKYTLLHYAIKFGQFAVVQLLVERGADLEKKYEDQTSLMYAIKHGQTKIMNYLIDKGADINSKNSQHHTPLFYVAQFGTVENARLLVSKGAETELVDTEGNTPVELAKKNQNLSVARFLKNRK